MVIISNIYCSYNDNNPELFVYDNSHQLKQMKRTVYSLLLHLSLSSDIHLRWFYWAL